ncbi:MAG: hypothetical protein Q7R58_01085, partial [bacterium]|nr:hypothetical protein [bacterium]
MRTPLVLFLSIGALFTFGVQAHAAVLDSQLDDSAQATQPPDSYYWPFIYIRVQVHNYLSVGYVPTKNLSISGVRFRVNTSLGDYKCPTHAAVIQYSGTSTPEYWSRGRTIGVIRTVATTTPDTNGNCDYATFNAGDIAAPLALSPNHFYVFFMSAGGSLEEWVSMSGKPYASTTPQSFFGYRPATDDRYIWGTMGLDAPYFEFFDTVPPVSPTPNPCVATNSCASNVLFLPGIEGSRLYRPDYNGGTDQLWEPNIDSDAGDLFLTADGKSVRSDVYTRDVIDEAYGVGQNIYKSFIAQMNELKTDGTITDWKAVPYDWRLSFDDILNNGRQFPDGRIYYAGDLAATSSPYLIQELRRLAKSSKTEKVTIVAHSNGGLITKALIQKLG